MHVSPNRWEPFKEVALPGVKRKDVKVTFKNGPLIEIKVQ
jgi:hypothetical protein